MTKKLADGSDVVDAVSPWAMSARTWWAVLKRSWAEANDDNIGLIAAGTAFYAFAAIVPLLGSVVLIYGLIADTATVVANIRALFAVLPADAATVIGEQLATVVGTSEGKKGFGLIIAIALALYGASKGASSIVTALNIAYEEKETRGFFALYILAFSITAGAVVLALTAALSTAAFALLDSLIPAAPAIIISGLRLVSYVVLASLAVTAAACLYRFGPNRAHAKWAWLTPGSLAATLIWLAATIGFGFYVANFGNYGATYGSLGAVIVLLTWLWLSAYVFLLGAELNAELERQTQRDTTTGPSSPAGTPGAAVADATAPDTPPDTAPVDTDRPAKKPAVKAVQVGAASRVAGAGLAPTMIAVGGLGALRRGAAPLGIVLLAVGGVLAWSSRHVPTERGGDEHAGA